MKIFQHIAKFLYQIDSMKILHLSDFHFSKSGPKSIIKQTTLCNSLLKTLDDIDFDFIIFSGDLVNKGENKNNFEEAFLLLIKPILELKNIPEKNLFICQGNHDIDRGNIRKPILKYIDEEFKSNECIDQFSHKKNPDFIDALKPSKNYFDFLKNLDYDPKDFIGQMYTTHIRELNGQRIGIVSINSSFRSADKNDENKLIFPLRFIYEALERVSSAELKILIHHHPLHFFRSFNQHALEDVIHSKFDITFFGHAHKGLTSIDYTPKTGLIKILAPAYLKYHPGGDSGFSLVNFNFDNLSFKVETYLYNSKQEFFYLAPNSRSYLIPSDEDSKKQNSFRKKIRNLITREKDAASELFISFGENNFKFDEIFVEPLLRKQDFRTGKTDRSGTYNVKEIINSKDDFVIVGNDKCGKTSLLKYFHIKLLSKYDELRKAPFYIDFALEKQNLSIQNFKKRFRNYYEINSTAVQEILNYRGMVLLVDNFDRSKEWQFEFLNKLKLNLPKTRIVITTSKHSELLIHPIQFSNTLPQLIKFENLKSKQVRALANNWTQSNIHKREEIITKINSLFKQLHIPLSFWNVSLFLWVIKKSGDKSVQNNVGLVDLYIESLLERENLIKTNANFAYEKYLKLLAHLAHYLLIEHKKDIYTAVELDILNYIGNYLKRNPRLKDINPNHVWEYLKERGIFKKDDFDRYSFRLNGVFEYFIAYYMKLYPEFRNKAIKDDVFFLSFKNEFEIYAGFSRDDVDFLNKIFERTKEYLKPLNSKYDGQSLDTLLKARANLLPNYERKIIQLSKKAKSLSFEEQEEIDLLANELDIDSDIIEGVREKKPVDIETDEIGLFEDALFIVGRVFRNMDEIDSEKKVNEVFNYYLKTICQWGLAILDASKSFDFQSNFEDEDNIELLFQLMSSMIPLFVQMNASDHINQKNLDGVIKDKINSITSNKPKTEIDSQFELFILYYLLIDLNLIHNKKYILESLKYISIPILKNAILVKLNNYLLFKTNEDKEIELFLRNLIQQERLKLNNKLDSGDIQRELDDQKKQRYLN